MPKRIDARTFKARLSDILTDTKFIGDTIVVVKNGRPVVAVAPVRRRPYFGMDKGKIQILGDIVSPMLELWDEMRPLFPEVTASGKRRRKRRR
jgi:prevent-host-death family protein